MSEENKPFFISTGSDYYIPRPAPHLDYMVLRELRRAAEACKDYKVETAHRDMVVAICQRIESEQKAATIIESLEAPSD